MNTFPEQAILKTSVGSFHMTISSYTNRDTNVIEYYTVNIGGNQNKCVQLKVPSIESNISEGYLIWVESKSTCFLSANSKDKIAQHMVRLGFTVARDMNPNCTRYRLDDYSSFSCAFPNKKSQMVPLKPYHIAFHGQTWYEKYFGAKLVKEHDVYERLKLNLYDSAKKPGMFEFVNSELQELLTPHFVSSRTWFDFFQTIAKVYGDKKCSVIHPWILSALMVIFDGNNIFDNTKWYSDLEENKRNEKTPLIPFASYTVLQGGKRSDEKRSDEKRRKTRKAQTQTQTYQSYIPYSVNIPVVQKLNYRSYLQM